YRTYPVKDGRDGKPLPIILCDTMGIEENSGAGLEIDEVSNIRKGHVPDRYQDQIHCVTFVIDGKVNHFGIPQLVLLTKVDEICPTLEEDIQCVYQSKAVEKQ
ncbi:unnamed protein product, partial [Lepidochelys kempii]